MAEMERDQMTRELVERQDVATTWTAFMGRLRDNLLGLGDRCAPDILPSHALAERIAVIRRHVNASLRDVVAEIERIEKEEDE